MVRFRVFVISQETRGRVKTTFAVTESREEADRQAREAKGLGSIGIEEIPEGQAGFVDVVVGPKKSKRGRQLQREREQREKTGETDKERRVRKQKTITDINTQIERGGVSREERQELLEQRQRVSDVPASQFTQEKAAEVKREPEVLTQEELKKEKAEARQKRARETKRKQLRVAGREVIQEPSTRAFGVFETAFRGPSTTQILTRPELEEELRRTKGFVTFREPEKEDKPRRELIVPSLKPTERFEVTSVEDKGILPTATRQRRLDVAARIGGSGVFGGQETRLEIKETLEQKARRIERQERAFFQEGITGKFFEKTGELASTLTFGKGKRKEDRSFLGQTGEIVAGGLLQLPAIPRQLAFGVQKLGLAGEIFFTRGAEGRKAVLGEFRGAARRLKETGIFDPRTPQGLSTFLFAGLGTLIPTARTTVGKGIIEKVPRPRAETIRFDIAGEPKVVRTLGIEAEGRALSLVTIGKPKIPFKLSELTEPLPAPRTATATKVLQDVFEITPKEKARIKSVQKITRELRKEKGQVVKEAFFDIETFKQPKKASKIIEQAIAREEGVIFGTATAQQLPKGFRLRPGDIDVIFPRRTEAELIKFVKKTTRELKIAGEPVRVSKQNPLIIETLKQQKVLETKSGVDPGEFSGPEFAGKGGLGFDFPDIKKGRVGATVPFGEARAIRAGEQLQRKGVASTFFRPAKFGETPLEFQVPGIFPLGRRTKDIAGFVAQTKGLIAITKPSKKASKADQATGIFIETFSPEQQRFIQKTIKEKGAFRIELGTPELKVKPGVSPAVVAVGESISTIVTPRITPGVSPIISARPSVSPRVSISPRVSPSISASIRPSVSPPISPSPSPSISKLTSPSPSPSVSRSIRPSPSPSLARSISPSIRPSLSISPSPSPSVSPSPSPATIASGGLGGFVPLIPLLGTGPLQQKQAFNVEIRKGEKRGDKFKVAARNLPRNKALSFGARAVDSFIEASFRIKKTGRTTQLPDISAPNLNKFRRPRGRTKLPRNTFIERRKHRLDTFSEVNQISFFRRLAERTKPRKKRRGRR